jgi:hypothetical protein
MQTAASARRRVRGWFAEARDAIVSVFFPAGCRICDKLLTLANRVPICEECLGSFEATRKSLARFAGERLGEVGEGRRGASLPGVPAEDVCV